MRARSKKVGLDGRRMPETDRYERARRSYPEASRDRAGQINELYRPGDGTVNQFQTLTLFVQEPCLSLYQCGKNSGLERYSMAQVRPPNI